MSINSFRTRLSFIYNYFYFKQKGVKFGKKLRAKGDVEIHRHPSADVLIGDNFQINSGGFYNPLSRNIKACLHVTENASLVIGNNVGVSSCCIWARKRIVIGNNVLIGGDTIIIDTDAHSLDWRDRCQSGVSYSVSNDKKHTISKTIVIGNNVLIGTRCLILKGVEIGDNAIIGAGSVVTKSIPANCIAAGNPAIVIRQFN